MRKLCEMNECFANTSTPFSSIRRSATCCVYDGVLHHIESSCATVSVHTWHLHTFTLNAQKQFSLFHDDFPSRSFFMRSITFFPIEPSLLRGVYSIQIFHYVNFLPTTFCACVWNENNKHVEWASNNERGISEILHILNGTRDDFIFAERSAAHATHTTNWRTQNMCEKNIKIKISRSHVFLDFYSTEDCGWQCQ